MHSTGGYLLDNHSGYSFYNSPDEADAFLQSMSDCSPVALDTEFIRTRTFYPIPALYQLNGAGDIALIDATHKGDWSVFKRLLASSNHVKIMHACSEDLEVFLRHFRLVPSNLFDTQVAHAFISEDFSISYARLVHAQFGVELDKQETRSNWLLRPLSTRQQDYAADDVHYLLELHSIIQEKLVSLGRMEWFEEEMQSVLKPNGVTPANYFRSVKRSRSLSSLELSRLQEMCLWREKQARSEDVPRSQIVKDEYLVSIAALSKPDPAELRKILSHRSNEKYGKHIADAFEAGHARPQKDHPVPNGAPLTQSQGNVIKKLKKHANQVATELKMAPELLGRKRDLESSLRSFLENGELADVHTGWRKKLVGDEFLNIMDKSAS